MLSIQLSISKLYNYLHQNSNAASTIKLQSPQCSFWFLLHRFQYFLWQQQSNTIAGTEEIVLEGFHHHVARCSLFEARHQSICDIFRRVAGFDKVLWVRGKKS